MVVKLLVNLIMFLSALFRLSRSGNCSRRLLFVHLMIRVIRPIIRVTTLFGVVPMTVTSIVLLWPQCCRPLLSLFG